MPLDFAAAICESETAAAGVLVDVFFVEPPTEVELGAEVAGAAGALAAGAEFDIAAAALLFAADDLLELLAVVFELSAVAAPASAALDFSALFFRLLLAPAVLVLAGSLEVSAEVAPAVSDFVLFLLLLFVELLLVASELAELSDVAESDFFDLDFVPLFDELESLAELVLLVVSSEVDFFFFLLLADVVP
jgi:hypothetical protein